MPDASKKLISLSKCHDSFLLGRYIGGILYSAGVAWHGVPDGVPLHLYTLLSVCSCVEMPDCIGVT